jgi:hypothetical protein
MSPHRRPKTRPPAPSTSRTDGMSAPTTGPEGPGLQEDGAERPCREGGRGGRRRDQRGLGRLGEHGKSRIRPLRPCGRAAPETTRSSARPGRGAARVGASAAPRRGARRALCAVLAADAAEERDVRRHAEGGADARARGGARSRGGSSALPAQTRPACAPRAWSAAASASVSTASTSARRIAHARHVRAGRRQRGSAA